MKAGGAEQFVRVTNFAGEGRPRRSCSHYDMHYG